MDISADDYMYAVPIFERVNNSASGGVGESQIECYRMLISGNNLHFNLKNVRQDSTGACKVDITFNVIFIR